MLRTLYLLSLSIIIVVANPTFPSWSWFAFIKSPGSGKLLSRMNATWVVPTAPTHIAGSTPAFWMAIEDYPSYSILQPTLAWVASSDGTSAGWRIFLGNFNWHTRDWWNSDMEIVEAGQTIHAWMAYDHDSDSYEMEIGVQKTGVSVRCSRPAKGVTYTNGFFVAANNYIPGVPTVEEGNNDVAPYSVGTHSNCQMMPNSGEVTFDNIDMVWENRIVKRFLWYAKQQNSTCQVKPYLINNVAHFVWSPGVSTSATSSANSTHTGSPSSRSSAPSRSASTDSPYNSYNPATRSSHTTSRAYEKADGEGDAYRHGSGAARGTGQAVEVNMNERVRDSANGKTSRGLADERLQERYLRG